MKYFSVFMAAVMAVAMTGCNSEEPGEWGGITPPGGSIDDGGAGDDLASFSIEWDESDLSESETIPSDESDALYEDYVENSTFSTTVSIAYEGNSATVSGEVEGVNVAVDGAHVTITSTVKKMNYEVSGTTTNGSLKIYSDNKFRLTLNNVNITNPTGAAINNQCKKRTFVVLADGSENTLVDGEKYTSLVDGEDLKGCFFSEGQLLFSGKGLLSVTGNYKHGIVSDDYVVVRPGVKLSVNTATGHGIKTNDGVTIMGGVLNIGVSGTAKKAINSEGDIVINGGRTTVITTGGGEWDNEDNDTKACAGLKSDTGITINGGTVLALSTGAGGKGMNCDGAITINGGTVKVMTTGASYTYGSYDSKAKGIKADGDLTINGGHVVVRTTGGEGSEGIESKAALTINDGTVEVSAYDDALNAKTSIAINGGTVYAYASNNDAIDSNGTLTIAGGVVVAVGAGAPECGFDCDNNTFAITGGTVIGIGGDTSKPTATACKQPSIISGNSMNSGTTMTLMKGNTCVLAFKVPRSFSTMLISSADLASGNSYSIVSGATVTGGTTFHGLTTGGTASGGSNVATVTLSSMVTTSNYSGGMQGGGGPGGGTPGGWGWH